MNVKKNNDIEIKPDSTYNIQKKINTNTNPTIKNTVDNKSSKNGLPKTSLFKKDHRKIENVLILQGGGSLGAFGCGVFKALKKIISI